MSNREIRHFWWLLGAATFASFCYHFWLESVWYNLP